MLVPSAMPTRRPDAREYMRQTLVDYHDQMLKHKPKEWDAE
jgi:hypothetical protein